MRRGPRPAKSKAESNPPLARKPPKDDGTKVRDLEKRLAEALEQLQTRDRELAEAQEQQAGAADILRLIAKSPADLPAVLDGILGGAIRLMGAEWGAMARFDGELFHHVAQQGATPGFLQTAARLYPFARDPDSPSTRAITERHPVYIEDAFEASYRGTRELARAAPFRSLLSIPLLREGRGIGTINLTWSDVRPFPAHRIEVLQTFADQAVIAIENARLFNETKEALEQQTATAEILRVISSSLTAIQPVLDAIAQSATRLCEGHDAIIFLGDGETLRVGTHHGPIPLPTVAGRRAISRGCVAGRAVVDRQPVHVHDLAASRAEFPLGQADAVKAGHRTTLGVPLLREGEAIGVILIRRLEVRPFTDRQIALLQTFADQAVIAIENVRLYTELQEKNRALTTAHLQVTEALQQQMATSEILRVISSSPTDIQPVFDTIAERAMRLCDANQGLVGTFDGEQIHLRALANFDPRGAEAMRRVFPIRATSGSVLGRTVVTKAVVQIPSMLDDPEYGLTSLAEAAGFRSALGVPMLKDGNVIGTVAVTSPVPRIFVDREIALLQTFADQAVIAIENVRLFTELQAKNQALTQAHSQVTEALEQQTATSEILRVISTSPNDLQPVLDTIVQNAARLTDAEHALIGRADADVIRWLAFYGAPPSGDQPITRSLPSGRAILDRQTTQVEDIATIERGEFTERVVWAYREHGVRTILATPLLRKDAAVGVLLVRRTVVRSFTDKQIALLQTFADQAVIAIENVRLFEELEEKNRALTQSLEQQTATADILQVISRSPTDIEPVFEAVVASAARLCEAHDVAMLLVDGADLRLAAGVGPLYMSIPADFRIALTRGSAATRAVIDRAIVHIHDFAAESEEEYPVGRELARSFGHRSMLAVPLLREGVAIGVICAFRLEVRPFPDRQITLLRTFADQAVIAIENVRLFNELQAQTTALRRSVEQLTALGEVGRAVSSTLDLETVLTTIVSRAVELSGLDGGVVFEYDEEAEEFVQRAMTETGEGLAAARRVARVRKGEGVLGRTAITLEPVQVADIALPGAYEGRLREILIDSGIRAILAVPMVREGHLIGCLGVTRNHPGEFPIEIIDLLRTFATQSALAIQNARLYQEIEEKSRQLHAASQHKSEFLANMSHELRTPLNAVIGFSEVLRERMFGDVNEKQEEYLNDIHASGQHLLSLINDILDLSKIEAGRMELEPTNFHLQAALDNALALVRERAGRHGIALHATIDSRIGYVRADERKVKQVLLNLLSNAIKFTPDGGRIEVRAVPRDEGAEVSVSDTGVGIAPENQEAIFEEFRQVGTAEKKVEGTGLGLALSRKFIELHGGRIWVRSQLGAGSTFTFTIPARTGA